MDAREVHNYDRGSTYRNDGKKLVLDGNSRNRSVLQKGSSKVVFWPPRSLLHLAISNARRGFPRHRRWRLYIQSRQSADLFNIGHIRAKTKTTRILMRELLFADDSALAAHFAEEMKTIVDAFRCVKEVWPED